MSNKWLLRIFLAFGLTTMILGCQKDESIDSELSGTWIELKNELDTIDFDGWNSERVFILRRGFELVEGHMLPRYGSGIYRFKLKSDTIMINNMLWNCICYPSYFFQMNKTGNTFIIGNFYDTTLAASEHITFIRNK